MSRDDLPERARALLDCWFGPPDDPERETHRQIWFRSTKEHDDMLRERYLADYRQAASCALAAWEETRCGALALLLLLDQIPRNIFRNQPQTYATDAAARAAADRAVARGFDLQVPPAWRLFFYMPFHHSEEVADQRRAKELSAARLPPRPAGERGAIGRYGRPYLEVIERFGRFPHRNAILGRQSTPEEQAFLVECKLAPAAAPPEG